MKMTNALIFLFSICFMMSCGNGNSGDKLIDEEINEESVADLIGNGQIDIKKVNKPFEFDYDSNGIPMRKVFSSANEKSKCFFVISKVHPERLSVYEPVGNDTILLATYPVCIAKNRGQKERKGDNKTPESYPGEPFYIQQIQDASDWHHDFGDGRGSILAYGHWFMRLCTPGFSGIGIHGSTGNRESIINGRGSEGCIRLLDEDIIHLHDNYAIIGTKVIILPEDMEPLPFEKKAIRAHQSQVDPLPTIEITEQSTMAKSSNKEDLVLPKNETESIHKERTSIFSALKKSKNKQEDTIIEPENIKTWPDSVIVCGTRQRLRLGPTQEYDIYSDDTNHAICPNNGDILPCIGENGSYFKVIFQGKELFINKASCANNN